MTTRSQAINLAMEDFTDSKTVYYFEFPCDYGGMWSFVTHDIDKAKSEHPDVKIRVATLADLKELWIGESGDTKPYSYDPIWLADGLYQYNPSTSKYNCLIKTN
ncbi:hypothetical protein [Paenibacillus naphthalenovorans]|uniref:hypothetical protein n=1 Tax=Paenibacillus naphthalenovorans TaxID=162209 RepID=UPI003D2E3206